MALPGNVTVYRLLGKFGNNASYPKNAIEAAMCDELLEFANSLETKGTLSPEDTIRATKMIDSPADILSSIVLKNAMKNVK